MLLAIGLVLAAIALLLLWLVFRALVTGSASLDLIFLLDFFFNQTRAPEDNFSIRARRDELPPLYWGIVALRLVGAIIVAIIAVVVIRLR
jgi:hypothetical protein